MSPQVPNDTPGGGPNGQVWSVREANRILLLANLNTSRPATVPVFERDRWYDIENLPSTLPVAALNGYEDAPLDGQDKDRYVDVRLCKEFFEVYTRAGNGYTATQASDLIFQWIALRAGPCDAGHCLVGQAIRVVVERVVSLIGKGDVSRSLIEVQITYRNLVSDVTRVK